MNGDGDRRLRRLAGRARRVPGLRSVGSGLLPRVRSSAVLTDAVRRVFPPEPGLGAVRRPFRAGRHLTGADVDLLPVVAFDLLDVAPDHLAAAVEAVAALQRSTRAFRPVLVLGRPEPALAREHGYVVELVPSAQEWWGAPEDHAAHVARRLVSVREGFRPWHVVRLGPDGTVPARDADVLAAVRTVLGDDLDVRVLATPPVAGGGDPAGR